MANHDVYGDWSSEIIYSDAPPSHYSLKIEPFSMLRLMTKTLMAGYETEVFEAGGYEWNLVLYAKGNKKRDVEDHISNYLELAGSSSLQSDCEVYVDFRFFLLDQRTGKYLVLEDAFARKVCFHPGSPSYDKLMSLKEFTDPSNGYLLENSSLLGAEVFVCKERTKGKREFLSNMSDIKICKHVWKVKNFSKLTDTCYMSEPFDAGDQRIFSPIDNR